MQVAGPARPMQHAVRIRYIRYPDPFMRGRSGARNAGWPSLETCRISGHERYDALAPAGRQTSGLQLWHETDPGRGTIAIPLRRGARWTGRHGRRLGSRLSLAASRAAAARLRCAGIPHQRGGLRSNVWSPPRPRCALVRFYTSPASKTALTHPVSSPCQLELEAGIRPALVSSVAKKLTISRTSCTGTLCWYPTASCQKQTRLTRTCRAPRLSPAVLRRCSAVVRCPLCPRTDALLDDIVPPGRREPRPVVARWAAQS